LPSRPFTVAPSNGSSGMIQRLLRMIGIRISAN
jgi:hypothetical protein